MSAQPSRSFSKWRILLVFLLTIGSVAWALTKHPWARAQLDRELSLALRRELGLDASIGQVRLELPLRLAADAIELSHPEKGLLASAERLEVTPSLIALARGKLEIKQVAIEGAVVRLRIEDGQIVNLPKLPSGAKTSASTPERLPLEELVVRRATLHVDGQPKFSGQLSDVFIQLKVLGIAALSLEVQAGAGKFQHPAGRETVQRLLLAASMSEGKIELDELELQSSLLTVKANEGAFSWPLTKDEVFGGELEELSLDLAKVAALPHGIKFPPVSGKLSLKGKVSGTGPKFKALGEVRGDPVLDGFGFGQLELKVEVTPEQVVLLPGSLGRIVQDGGVVGLEGRLGFGPGLPVEVKTDIKHLDFHKLMAQLDVTQDCLVNWVLRGGFKLSGTIQPVAISGPIWAEHLSFRTLTKGWRNPDSEEVIGTPPGRVSGRVVIRPDALRFENLQGHLPHSDMLVTVHVGFDRKFGLTAKSTNLDLRDTTGLMGMSLGGRGGFTLDVGGTYENTYLNGTLDFEDFSIDGYRIGHIKTRASLENDGVAVRFKGIDVQKGESRYRVDDLFMDFSKAFSIDAKGTFEKLALADFYHTFVLENDPDFAPYQGHVRGTATVRYTLGFPGDLASGTFVLDTDLDVLDTKVHGVAFKGGKLEGRWLWRDISAGTRGARLELAELSLLKSGGSVVARGHMDYGAKLAFTVFAEKLPLSQMDPLKKSGVELAGEVGAVGTVRGTLQLPEAKLDVETVGVQLARRTLGDGHFGLYVSHRDDPWAKRALSPLPASEPCPRARAALARADWPGTTGPAGTLPPQALLVCGALYGDRIGMDLAIGLQASVPARGQLTFDRLSPALIWPQRRGNDVPLSGTLGGHLELTGGALADLDSLRGSLEITSLRIGQERAMLTSDGPVKITLTGRGASVERAHFGGAGTQIEVTGGASVARGLAASVQGKLDLRVLPTFVPTVARSTGLLDVSVKLTGDPSEPSVYGLASLRDGSLLLSGSDQVLDKVEARLTFSERELLLEQLRATVAGGTIHAHGSLALAKQSVGNYELFMEARDITYAPMDGVDLSFAADTRLTFDASRRIPQLTGTVRVQRLRYNRPFSLGITERLTGLSQAKRVERASYDPAKDRIAFDLRVVEDAPLKISNNLLNAELSIEDSEEPFRLVGTDQRMGVLGTLDVTRGTVTFRNSRFNLEEGTVTFIDENRVRPRLDIRARTEFRRQADASGARWWISLRASGEVDDLKLETSSEPALAQEDIALLLTVGMTRAEASRSNGLAQGAALEALATVTGVDREVRKALPVIDDFTVTSAYSARTNRTEPQVVVGKRLSERVRATARTGLTTDSNFKTGVEWRLDDQTSVEAGYDNVQTTTSSQFGNVGVDLRWRLEFD